MKAIILAAGFGSRLQNDINNNQAYSYLKNIPKGLLPIANKPILSYWAKKIKAYTPITEIFVVTNSLHFNQFVSWAKQEDIPEKNILKNTCCDNNKRNGAIVDFLHPIKHFNIEDEDIFLIASDTLLSKDFSLTKMHKTWTENQILHGPSNQICAYPLNSKELVSKYGIVEIDQNKQDKNYTKVLSCKEKPKPNETNSILACPAVYILSKESLPIIKNTLKQKLKNPKTHHEKDIMGKVIGWTYKTIPTFTLQIEERFDIGNLQSYIETDEFFKSLKTRRLSKN
ncbi:NTP transferase domain-containing protein [archaeon]|jgi:dTDP-glucose pyrophosphorylase|nr:NTP transferase domain-containing protein [archaeon]MBT6697542.1 NTP transferase domain-containing protein [archaeon]